jgi:hypothetical protein
MTKFGRNYRMDIFNPAGEKISISFPITLQFNITRNTLASANSGQFTLYNLNETTRNRIFKDRYTNTQYWRVQLFAGYGNRLFEVFRGQIYEAYHTKKATEWITNIDCYDGLDAIQNGYTSQTIAKGTDLKDVVTRVITDLPNTIKGALGSASEGDGAPRGKVLLGPSMEILSTETDGNVYIDKETINVLTDEEVLGGLVTALDSDTLLQTPKRRDNFLEVKTLFEPDIQVGQVYEINSIEKRYNGQYKVQGFSHSVMISASVAGEATTTISLNYSKKLTEVFSV